MQKNYILQDDKTINVKLYPIYKAMSWDLIFYYTIIFLFLTQIKGFTPADVMLSSSVFSIAMMCFQIPAARLSEKFGKRRSLIVGNIAFATSILCMILMNQVSQLMLIQIMFAFGYSVKGMCEANILFESLPKGKKQGGMFSNIDGKSASYFYVIDAISSIIAGFTFALNGYIPMVLCFLTCVCSCVLSFKFREVEEEKEEMPTLTEYTKELLDVIKFVKNSDRVKMLILIYAVFMGVTKVLSTMRSGILADVEFKIMYSGILFAVLQFIAALASGISKKIHDRARNKTLSILIIPFVVSTIFMGIIGNFSTIPAIVLIIVMFAIQYMVKGPFMVLSTRYFTNFTNDKIRPNLYAVRNIIANLVATIFSMIASLILGFSSNANTCIILGCIGTLIIVLTLDKMRHTVGLSVKEYTQDDLKYFEKEEITT